MKNGATAVKRPSCGAAKLVRDTCNIHFKYKGETTTIESAFVAFIFSYGRDWASRSRSEATDLNPIGLVGCS